MSATTTTSSRKSKAIAKKPALKKPELAGSAGIGNGYFLLLTLVVVICAFGLMMVLSSSSVEALRSYGSSWAFFKRQIVWLAMGAVVLWVVVRTDYQKWRRFAMPLLVAAAGLLFLVLVPGIGITVYGSQRWLGAGSLRMQPSEIAKFAMLVFSADLLSRREKLMGDWRQTTRPILLIAAVFVVLIMAEPDMGTTMILGSIAVITLFVAGTPIKRMAKLGGAVVLGAAFLAIVEPYRRERLLSFTNPWADAGNTGYQMVQSLVAFGSGGITGVGLGASRAKWGFLPNAHTDFIFAIIGEELGLIGAGLVVLMFIGFALLGVRAASNAPDRFGMLMASGITAWVVLQAFLNIGAVIGILPVTGVPLPFLSQGGSSLIILMAATGILLNIAKQGEEAKVKGTKTVRVTRTTTGS